MTQSCKNCKHAEFHRTPTGPISTDIPQAWAMMIQVSRFHIWPDDGTTCAAWSPK